MPLNPIDVQQKTFGTALRGYDLDEVDDFLDSVVTTLKDYESQLAELRGSAAELERKLAERGDSEGVIARALVAAQRSADMIIEEAKVQAAVTAADAKTEAEETLEAARGEASQLTATREAEEEALRAEIASVKDRAARLRAKVRGLLEDVNIDLESVSEKLAEVEAAADEPATPTSEEVAADEEFEQVEAADDHGTVEGDEDEIAEAGIDEDDIDDEAESRQEDVADEAEEALEEVKSSMRPWERG